MSLTGSLKKQVCIYHFWNNYLQDHINKYVSRYDWLHYILVCDFVGITRAGSKPLETDLRLKEDAESRSQQSAFEKEDTCFCYYL